MFRTLALLSLFMLFLSASLRADIVVKPAGLRIAALPYAGESKMRPFNHTQGVCLVLSIVAEGDLLIADFLPEESVIESVFDSLGLDLLNADPLEGRKPVERRKWYVHATISEDSKSMIVRTGVFNPFALPSKGAESITLAGTLAVKTAASSQTYREKFEPAVGAVIDCGPFTLTVEKIDPEGGFGQTDYEITFVVTGDVDAFQSVDFSDSQGGLMKRYRDQKMNRRVSGGEKIHSMRMLLSGPPQLGSEIVVDLWEGVVIDELPVEAEFTLGFAR